MTPSERTSVFAAGRYEIATGLRAFAKALYNRRESINRAAPEPIFVGPDAGTGGIADTVFIPAEQPFNPFGFDLDPASNFSLIGRRPLEGGPRIFEQEVNTVYVSGGLQGDFELGGRLMNWDFNLVTSTNEAEQTFRNGYNVQRIKNALGDPAACAAIEGCVPLNLFGGQGPDGRGTITQEMLEYIRITTQDASENKLNLASANLTGDLYDLPAGAVAFATGLEYRRYEGSFTPDPARVAGESQDSTAIPTSGEYDVAELYGELNIPVIAELQYARRVDLSLALRYSDYSNFGSKLTGKAGFRWEILDELMSRGTYAQGFRAPFIGELYGLTQFGASITDPCSNAVPAPAGASPEQQQLADNCTALGVPDGYAQINPQITTNTGGNPDLEAEEADSVTLGLVYSPDWADALFDSRRLDFELTWYHHRIDGAIRAPDAQARLEDCVDSGDPDSPFCQGMTRTPNGQINRFTTLLVNSGGFETSGWDFKADWAGPGLDWGALRASLQVTYVSEYRVTDELGQEAPQKEGVEVNDGAIPRVQANLQLDWNYDTWTVGLTTRYIGRVTEACTDALDGTPASFAALGLCSDPENARNELEATIYNDVQVGWDMPFGARGFHLDLGIQNVLDQDPPVCLSCSLNGYDAGTYDAPGMFGYGKVQYRF